MPARLEAIYAGGMAEQRPGSGETMRRMGLAAGLAIGMGVGVALGAALRNMGTGIALGVVIGAAVMVLFTIAGARMQRDEQRRRSETHADADEEPADGLDPGRPDPGGANDGSGIAAPDDEHRATAERDQPSADSRGSGS